MAHLLADGKQIHARFQSLDHMRMTPAVRGDYHFLEALGYHRIA